MTLTLPAPIAAYFAADGQDGDAIARCFTPDAIVVDEKQSHTGRTAISRWKTDAAAKYDYVSTPVDVSREGERYLVVAHVAGNFPGSPVDLRYRFTLADDAIARLEIVP